MTLVRLLAGMYAFVLAMRRRIRESFIAVLAHEWLFAGVASHVRAKGGWRSEQLLAHVALKRFLAGVDTRVHRHSVLCFECFAAMFTAKWSICKLIYRKTTLNIEYWI